MINPKQYPLYLIGELYAQYFHLIYRTPIELQWLQKMFILQNKIMTVIMDFSFAVFNKQMNKCSMDTCICNGVYSVYMVLARYEYNAEIVVNTNKSW